MLRVFKRIILFLFLVVVVAVAGFVFLIGPWPLYEESNYTDAAYFTRSLAAIDEAASTVNAESPPGPLQAGWAERDITPEAGHPMAGYGGRTNEKRSEGIHDRLYVRALALSDGMDTVVLIGSDMLQTLPNLLVLVAVRIAEVGLTNSNIFYTSSHTHGGPGGLAPGMVAKQAYGEYSEAYVLRLADQFAEAIIEAFESMATARFAHGAVELPEYIRNRARPGDAVDGRMHVAVVERMDGERIYIARYSAHATAYGEEMMQFNNDYAGAFQRAVQEAADAPLLFMSGGVGAMRPYPPGPPMPEPRNEAEAMGFENDIESRLVREGKKTLDDLLREQEARVEAMGRAMAERLLKETSALSFQERVDIAAFASAYTPPPAQARLMSNDWRMSPYLFRVLVIPTTGRLQAARIGSMMLIGTPYDLGGEISVAWQAWAAQRGVSLWPTSFSGAYLGYLSPDSEYYNLGEEFTYNQNYEIGQLGWFGPQQEAYVTELFEHAFEALAP